MSNHPHSTKRDLITAAAPLVVELAADAATRLEAKTQNYLQFDLVPSAAQTGRAVRITVAWADEAPVAQLEAELQNLATQFKSLLRVADFQAVAINKAVKAIIGYQQAARRVAQYARQLRAEKSNE